MDLKPLGGYTVDGLDDSSGEFMLRQWIAGLIALGTLTHASRAQAPDSSRLRTLQYRWVIGENLTSSGYLDPATGMRYILEDKVVLDVDGVERAEAHPMRISGNSGWDVIVRLTPRAASEFAETTAAHVGRTLAVLMEGHIISTAVVETPLRRVAGVVTNVPKSVADSIATRINAVKAAPSR